MNLVNEITREIWNNAKEYYNLSDKVDCLRLIKDLFMLLDTKETSMKIMEKEIESASLKTKELEKQLQKEAMKQLSLLDQIKELEEKNKRLKKIIKTGSEACCVEYKEHLKDKINKLKNAIILSIEEYQDIKTPHLDYLKSLINTK